MTKGETIVLRISSENKETIKAAAVAVNKSLTTFITDAALKEAERVKRHPPTLGIHSGLPSWFRATCYEASKGGTGTYEHAGFKLAAALHREIPRDIEDDDDWAPEVEKLEALLDGDDDDAVLTWFEQHYPRCIALVPSRRRGQFVAGVRRAHEDGAIEL